MSPCFNSDGNIRYFEYENDEMFFLSSYQSPEPQRGMAFLPKRSVNVAECEVVRAYKVTSSLVEPISFKVPRKVRRACHDLDSKANSQMRS